MPTQTEMILNDLKEGKKISALDALKEYGCLRLSSRIHELKRDGWPIMSTYYKSNKGKTFKRFWLCIK